MEDETVKVEEEAKVEEVVKEETPVELNSVNNNTNSNPQPVQNKKTPVGVIVAIVVGAVLISIIGLVLIVYFLGLVSTKEFAGTWNCNDQITVEINGDNFNMYSNDRSAIVNAKYQIVETEKANNYNKYLLNATATRRYINGKELTGDYTTQYQIVIDPDYPNTLTMMNTVTYSIYSCTRK